MLPFSQTKNSVNDEGILLVKLRLNIPPDKLAVLVRSKVIDMNCSIAESLVCGTSGAAHLYRPRTDSPCKALPKRPNV